MKKFQSLSEPMKIALIGAAGLVLASVLGAIISGLFRNTTSPITIVTPTATAIIVTSPTHSPGITDTVSSTTQVSPTSTMVGSSSVPAYDFEDGTTQGWDTSEGQYKLATLQVVSDPIRAGNHVLQVMTKLTGDTNREVYRHTDAKVYFTQRLPIGFSNQPPYNFQGQQVSCQVYLPHQLALGSLLPTVTISVKDTSQRNDSGKPITIDASKTDHWFQISFIVGKYPEDADQGFDGTQIISVGIQVVVPPGSTLEYTGPFYIDNCVLPH